MDYFAHCFGSGAAMAEYNDGDRTASTIRSSTAWIRSKAHELPDIGGRCRIVVSRIGNHHRRRQSCGDFAYDPLSYALNFDDGDNDDGGVDGGRGRFRCRNFSSRLPNSPPASGSLSPAG